MEIINSSDTLKLFRKSQNFLFEKHYQTFGKNPFSMRFFASTNSLEREKLFRLAILEYEYAFDVLQYAMEYPEQFSIDHREINLFHV